MGHPVRSCSFMHCYPTFGHSHVKFRFEAGSETSHFLAYSQPINCILAEPCLSALYYYGRITCRGRQTTWSRPWPTASGRTRHAGAPPEVSSCNVMGNGCSTHPTPQLIEPLPCQGHQLVFLCVQTLLADSLVGASLRI